MDQLEAMQQDRDRDNWNEEEMLEAAVGLINLDSDLQSSGNSTSSAPPLTVTVAVMVLGAW